MIEQAQVDYASCGSGGRAVEKVHLFVFTLATVLAIFHCLSSKV
jgi:hypothetical protein